MQSAHDDPADHRVVDDRPGVDDHTAAQAAGVAFEVNDRSSRADLARDRDAQLAVRLALANTVEAADKQLMPILRGVDVFTAWEMVRTNWQGKFDRCQARLGTLELDAIVATTARLGARVVLPCDDEWPTSLDDLRDPPFCLWLRGRGHLDELVQGRSLSMVGSRAATAYGTHVAADIAMNLAGSGFTVVSGGAFGIDAASHRGALAAGGRTIAAMAGGIDRLYPVANTELLEQVMVDGVLITEQPPGWSPQRQRFLSRNRLIAALTAGTLVVEANLRSGSLSTAREADDIGRVVGAVPGPVTSPASAGTNKLIRDNKAVLVGDAEECADLFGAIGDDCAPDKRAAPTLFDTLPTEQQRLLNAMPVVRGTSVERLAASAGMTGREVLRALAVLGADGLVERAGPGWRRRQRV
ncbi:DNA-processing protein DprA [Rudaeicoccus suwonensis]|uniref:DNA-processing protein DprA n=1 Tax=Rudaeicoccus suwonensis TaxID=657409 RepID=UPI001476FA02|nr:DNA-processing protein DprA [Rudaeicoccus suwonensis]